MSIKFHENVSASDLPKGVIANTHLIYVEVDNIAECANELVSILKDTSWIDKLDAVGKATFESTAARTIQKLLELFGTITNDITSAFGEYVVSMKAGQSLNQTLSHVVFPIADIWKEKITGNPGFDFHTESLHYKVSFGEAKYRHEGDPFKLAADQILAFIGDKKDLGDAGNLKLLKVSNQAIQNLLKQSRGFCVAFSINSSDYKGVLRKALNSDSVIKIGSQCDELFIVGIAHASN